MNGLLIVGEPTSRTHYAPISKEVDDSPAFDFSVLFIVIVNVVCILCVGAFLGKQIKHIVDRIRNDRVEKSNLLKTNARSDSKRNDYN